MPEAMYLKFGIFVVIGGLLLWRFHATRPAAPAPRRTLRDFVRDDEAGAGALDFVLTFTFFFPVVMMTVQMLLVFNAYLFVKYAAFYAARSAIVTIPEDYSSTYKNGKHKEERNVLGPGKRQTIREAAAWAVSPVSPMKANVVTFANFSRNISKDAASVGLDPGDGLGNSMKKPLSFDLKWLAYMTRNYPGIFVLNQLPLYLGSGRSFGSLTGGLGNFVGINVTEFARFDMWEHKVGNALVQTTVEFYDADGKKISPNHEFGATDPVIVEVNYRFRLAMPIARQLLKDGPRMIRLSDLLTPGLIFNPPNIDDLSGNVSDQLWERAWDPYVNITARCAMQNEGWGDRPEHFIQPKFESDSKVEKIVSWFKDNVFDWEPDY